MSQFDFVSNQLLSRGSSELRDCDKRGREGENTATFSSVCHCPIYSLNANDTQNKFIEQIPDASPSDVINVE